MRTRKRSLLSPIVDSLRFFKGNARTCILVEPMWGISYNLFVPYASLYMLALGVNEAGIGALATLSMALQMVWSLIAGWITDRFGRRRTSLIFDLMSWSIPTLLWAVAQDFRAFLVASILNSMVRVVHISWSCLFIEDAPPDSRVRLYTWMSVAGTLAGFFAPLAGLLVTRFSLVPATRGLYIFAFVLMTSMFFIRNAFTKETAVGLEKMAASRNAKARDSLREYRESAGILFRNKQAVLAFLLAVLSNIHLQTRNSFLSVVLTKGIGLEPGFIAVFPPLASGATLAVYFLVIPRITRIRMALSRALFLNIIANLLLFLTPGATSSKAIAIASVMLGTLAAAIGMGVAGPIVDAVLANSVDEKKRAVTMSIVYTFMFAVSAPSGWIAGLMAEKEPRLPALFAAAVMVVATILALMLTKDNKKSA